MRTIGIKTLDKGHLDSRVTGKFVDEEARIIPVLYHNKENCCGCSACYAICSGKAIRMEPDEEGFLYPRVMADQCTCCYLCLSVCAFQSAQKEKHYILD